MASAACFCRLGWWLGAACSSVDRTEVLSDEIRYKDKPAALRAASLAYSPGSWHLDGPAGITVAVCLGLGWVSSVRRVMPTLSMYS